MSKVDYTFGWFASMSLTLYCFINMMVYLARDLRELFR